MRPEESGELEAFRDCWAAAPPEIVSELGASSALVGGTLCIAAARLPVPLVNRTLGLGLSEPATTAQLDEIDAFFRPSGNRYFASVAPHARPADIVELLEDRGFEPGYHWQKFSRGIEPPVPVATDLRIEEVGAERGDDFGAAVAAGFELPAAFGAWFGALAGRPGWHCFVGYADEMPAAGGTLHVTEAVGWLGMGASLPAFRRRGGQGAILAARIRRAAELGCETVVTETGVRGGSRAQASHDNIERLGFQATYVRENWLSPPRGQARASASS